MGFIDYQGNKEDHYDDVLEYSKAQQKEEWKKRQQERIYNWLIELPSDGNLAKKNIQELLKGVMGQYKLLSQKYDKIISSGNVPDMCDTDRLWKDFAIDVADRHIRAFHTTPENKEKHLQVFISRIYKFSEVVSASEHFDLLENNRVYRKHFAECFDLTWTNRYFYHLLQHIGEDRIEFVEDFFKEFNTFALLLNLYLYQALQPRDDAWMKQIELERLALEDIQRKYNRKVHIVVDLSIIQNPIYVNKLQKNDEDSEDVVGEFETAEIDFDKSSFLDLIERKDLSNYIKACHMLVDFLEPGEICENYKILTERMPVLLESIEKHKDIYQVDIYQFEEYYAPETLRLTLKLIELEVINPSDDILSSIRENVLQATRKLIMLVNEKIDEIYKFVTIELNAEARALEAVMSQDGYVDNDLRIK
ncbi:hypothetical protein [Pseudobutyrivibrio ruminis]|uniref:hypothetical protein n=1 Tax=Pseudobutyrivibrio ruminis TaxID=46206 RepID=UPI000418EEC4|nr:hypothetical protein [Pseudobutyrivibrio ruminis]